jgi:hypothetical protein
MWSGPLACNGGILAAVVDLDARPMAGMPPDDRLPHSFRTL